MSSQSSNSNINKFMTPIESPELDQMTNFIVGKEIGIAVLRGKCEVFSCQQPSVFEMVNGNSSSKSDIPKEISINGNIIEYSSTRALDISSTKSERMIATASVTDNNNVYLEPWIAPNSDLALPGHKRRSNSISSNASHQGGGRIHHGPIRRRASSLGDMEKPSARRLLLNLISTLNDFFPDYDFETTKPEQFVIQDRNEVIRTVNTNLAELSVIDPTFLRCLWKAIDNAVNLQGCEVFSYTQKEGGDDNDDPLNSNSLWSFNYFFYNEDLKRICYFTCVAHMKYRNKMDIYSVGSDDDESFAEEDDEDDDVYRMHVDSDSDENTDINTTNNESFEEE